VTPADGGVAVVDVGSNSVRLFLCSGVGPQGPEGERLTRITGLRRGAGADGTIAPDALARLDACLAVYGERIAGWGAARVLVVGTSAVRDAPNRAEVDAIVRRRLGRDLIVLGGDEEARLAFLGARLAAPGPERVLVVDVGGGSTELVRGGPDGPEAEVSLQLGSVRSSERHLHGDPPRPGELRALRDEAAALVTPAVERVGRADVVIGVAGTATTLAAVRLGGYDPDRVHGLQLARAEVEAITARLAALPLAERRAVPGLHPDRAPVIVGGGLIVAAVLEAARAGGLLVSERDLLDGAVLAGGALGAVAA
jgi:exopolyphosphatase/guanosine-5'-triphosphate,3'-diphosphate pyrophosphatase